MKRPSEATQAMVGKTVGGRFLIERLLGEGGMGAVFAAREVKTSDRVALKIVHADLVATQKEHVDRFIQETLAAALVNHPNVVQALGAFGDDDGRPVLMLELLDGESLDRVIRRGPLPTSDAISIAIQASEGIAAVHSKNIVHRDLKPANIFLTRDASGEILVKVLDFGVALLQDPLRHPEESRHTGHGILLGTLEYMSPEQLQDARAADARSDVYALGVILFEMLSGRTPFQADTDPMLVVRILSEPPMSLTAQRPDLSLELVAVVERALAKQPSDRYPTMQDFALALAPFLQSVAVPAHVEATRPALPARAAAPAPPKVGRKLPWYYWALAVVAVIAVAAAALLR